MFLSSVSLGYVYPDIELNKHTDDKDLVNWYYNYITQRNLTTEIGDYTGTISIDIGFPQGGVCSAKFWSIAFNRAIEIVNEW